MNGYKTPRRYTANNENISPAEVEVFTERKNVCDDGLGSKWMFWKRRRYFIIMMVFLGEVTKELLRTNLSVAVFPMTENHSITDENGNISFVQDFDWDVKTRGFLLSIFYYGLVATHILGGILALKYGGTKVYGLGVAITATSTLLTPSMAYVHFYLLLAVRILEGVSEGILRPSVELIYARWIPVEERSSLVALADTGASWGVMFGFVVSAAVAYHWGWSAIFYFTEFCDIIGGFGITWYVVWFFSANEHPVLDKMMLSSELTYIQKSARKDHQGRTKISAVPFTKIFTSIPLLVLILAYVPMACSCTMFSTQLPAYIKDVLKLGTQNSGYLSSLPFALKVAMMYCISPFADLLINRKILSTTTTRKLYICGSLITMGVFSFLIQRAETIAAVMACVIVINVTSGVGGVQVLANMLDLAPTYSSILTGIIFTVSSTCGMFVPTLTGYLTQNKTPEEWHTVFSIQAGACLFGAAIYCVLGSGLLQSWAAAKEQCNADTRVEDVY